MKKYKCHYCKKEIQNQPQPFQIERNKNFYCDRKCYIKYVTPSLNGNHNFFEKIDTEEKSYWLGFIMADGCMNDKGNKTLLINLSDRDGKHLEKFSQVFGKSIYRYKDKNGFDKAIFQIRSDKMWGDLLYIGAEPRKTYGNSIEVFNSVKDDLIVHFVRGFFDGDGCITFSKYNNESKYGCKISFAGTKNFLIKIREIILDKIGLSKENTLCHQEGCFVLNWGGIKQIQAFYNWIYKGATIFLERKKEKFEECISIHGNKKTSSKYRGVTWNSRDNKWQSSIWVEGKRKSLGYFTDENEAALAHNIAVIKYGFPKYKLNEIRI